MRLRRVIAGLLCLATLACVDMKAIMGLAEALQTEYHMPVNVNINNGNHLTVTFPSDAIAQLKLSDADRASFARGVARFAVSHYQGEPISDVQIAFQSVSNAGPITMTRTDAPFRFTANELK